MATSNNEGKTGVTAERLQTGQNFARNRESTEEFGTAVRAAKLFRSSIVLHLTGISDKGLIARIGAVMRAILVKDAINDRGKRNAADGPVELLREFEINLRTPLQTRLKIDPTMTINRVAGELTLGFPAMVPDNVIAFPREATHFKLIAGGLEIDFKQNFKNADVNESDLYPLDSNEIPAFQMVAKVTPNSAAALFLLAGIRFYQKIPNGKVYPLNNKTFNALKVVDVSKV